MNSPQMYYVDKPEVRAMKDQTRIFQSLLSGHATFEALVQATQELSRLAPNDCDILVIVGDVAVQQVRFIEPHTFSFEGFNQDGHRAWVVQHFSQLSARIVYLPKRGPSRVITGFSNAPSA